ncbi:MAG: hypothetical protein KG029_11355 [Bacteroidetes bacterium]|nr:hypothetical protein [Bacteroidota bacterium]
MKYRTFIIVLIILGLGVVAYIYYNPFEPKKRDLFDAIPIGSSIVFESNQTGILWRKIQNETSFNKALEEIDFFKKFKWQLSILDSLLGSSGEAFFKEIEGQKMILSLVKSGGTTGFVFASETGNALKIYEIPHLAAKTFGQRLQVVDKKIGNYKTAILIDKQHGVQFNYCLIDGVFIGSFEKELLELALIQLDSKYSLLNDSAFVKVRNTRGSLVDGYLYVKPSRFAEITANNTVEKYKNRTKETIQLIGSWTALDLVVKQNEVLLNGFTIPESSGSFAALKDQKAVELKLLNTLPYNTRLFLHFGMSDYALYHSKTVNQEKLDLLSTSLGVDFKQSLIPEINAEIALAYKQGSGTDDVFIAARIKDQEIVSSILKRLVTVTGGKTQVEKTNISFINAKGLPAVLFGEAFSPVENFYYVFMDEYLLIANDSYVLEDIERLVKRGRTLKGNDNFSRFANNLSDESNILLYSNIREGFNLLSRFVDSKMLFHLNRNQKVVREFEAFALQLSASDKLVYTSFVLKYNPDYKEESLISWKTQLDAPMILKPFIVNDHQAKSKNIVVFDKENRMYLISADGQILWKKQLSETPMSEVFVVDHYKNGKLQYLFNTANNIHLIDRNGNNVGNFPVRLKSQATNGISVFDYENKKDYRILVCGADRIIYNFGLNGKEIADWEKPRTTDIVTKPVERLLAGNLDYIITTDAKGDIRIIDRRGRLRISPRGEINKSLNADFYINRTNSRGVLLTTNKIGHLLYVSGTGALATTDFGNYSAEHFFLYEDFSQNRSLDFIYLDGADLKIFDRFKTLIFSHKFKNTIHTKPVFFNIDARKRLLGVVDEAAKEIYLIDKDGKMIIGSGLTGNTPFAVESLYSNEEINLITGNENMLINYQIY